MATGDVDCGRGVRGYVYILCGVYYGVDTMPIAPTETNVLKGTSQTGTSAVYSLISTNCVAISEDFNDGCDDIAAPNGILCDEDGAGNYTDNPDFMWHDNPDTGLIWEVVSGEPSAVVLIDVTGANGVAQQLARVVIFQHNEAYDDPSNWQGATHASVFTNTSLGGFPPAFPGVGAAAWDLWLPDQSIPLGAASGFSIFATGGKELSGPGVLSGPKRSVRYIGVSVRNDGSFGSNGELLSLGGIKAYSGHKNPKVLGVQAEVDRTVTGLTSVSRVIERVTEIGEAV